MILKLSTDYIPEVDSKTISDNKTRLTLKQKSHHNKIDNHQLTLNQKWHCNSITTISSLHTRSDNDHQLILKPEVTTNIIGSHPEVKS